MEFLNLILSKPIIALLMGYLGYVAYIVRQNKKMRKDLEQRSIIDEINRSNNVTDNLELTDLVRLENERKAQRRHDSENGRDSSI